MQGATANETIKEDDLRNPDSEAGISKSSQQDGADHITMQPDLYQITITKQTANSTASSDSFPYRDNEEMAHLYDDTPVPFNDGQITTYVKRGEMNPISLESLTPNASKRTNFFETEFDSPAPPSPASAAESPQPLSVSNPSITIRGNMDEIITQWLYDDLKYKRDLSKTEGVFTKHDLSGRVINDLSIEDIKQMIYDDITAFMTTDTFDIMMRALNKWKTQNKLWMSARSAPQIAQKLFHIPITQLTATLNKNETMDRVLQDEMVKTIQLQTGWRMEECEQIKLVLLKQWIFTESQFIENMNHIFANNEDIKDIPHPIMDQIKRNIIQFDVETLQFKIKNNQNIDAFSERMISLMDGLEEEKDSDRLPALYNAISQCFMCVHERIDEVYNHWVCSNCGNYNWNQCIHNKMNTNLSTCALCGISQMDAISLKIRNYDTFVMVNEENTNANKTSIDLDIKDDIDETIHDVMDAYKIDLKCPARNDDHIICPCIYRLARVLIAFNGWLKKLKTFDVKSTTMVDIETFVDNATFKKIFTERVQSMKRIEEKEKEIWVQNIHDNVQNIYDLKTYLNHNKKTFAATMKQLVPSIKRAVAYKMYINIQKALKQIAQKHQFGAFLAELDGDSIDNDYHHILKMHIHYGNKSTLRNVFRFFNTAIHYTDTESEIKKCRSIQRRTEREKQGTRASRRAAVGHNVNHFEYKDIWSLKQYYIQSQLDMIHSYLVHSEWQRMDKLYSNQQYTNQDMKEYKDEMDATVDSDEIIDKFVSEFGFGAKYVYPQLSAQYLSIHDELIHNTLCPLDETTFYHLLIKAIKKHYITMHDEAHKMVCKYFDAQYNILRNEPIGVSHILAIILYTDLSNFCKTYRETYRRIGGESETHLIQKHCQLYHYARCLFESVEFYGEYMTQTFKVYHGLGVVLHFKQFTAQFNQPISTTTSFLKAQEFSKGVGIILELQSALNESDDPRKSPKYLAVSWLSQFPQENEKLLYGSSVILKIVNITEAESLEGHRHELTMLNTFQHMTQNQMVQFKEKMVEALVLFIQHQQHNKKQEIKTKSRYVSEYGQALFVTFCRHPHTTNICIYDYIHTLPMALQAVLFHNRDDTESQNKDASAISIIPMLKVFPYLKQIELTHLDLDWLITNATHCVNVVFEYINNIKNMNKIYLKRISFKSKPHDDTQENETLRKVQTTHLQALGKHRWRFDYEVESKEEAIHCLTFVNVDYDLEKEIKRLQVEQQEREEREAELLRQSKREEQLARIKKKNTMNDRDITRLIPFTISQYMTHYMQRTGSHVLRPPHRWDFTTVVMVADVSGFTKLTRYFDKMGPGGAEKLAFYLNTYLEQLGKKVRSEGGDTLEFAGDMMITIWPPEVEEEKLDEARQSILREERIARAVQAARAIQTEFHQMEIIKNAVTLSVKIGVGYGPSSLLFVGGQLNRIEYVLLGSALKQAFNCESNASPGDVMISAEAYQYVKEKYVYARPVSAAEPKPTVYKVALDRKKYKKVRSKTLTSSERYLVMEHYQPFVPQAAWTRLIARYIPWHGEQRVLSVLFISLDFSVESISMDLLQKAMETTQQCIYRYKGSLNKFVIDGKGNFVVAAFGLSPMTNFDDCTRAVLAALSIEEKMKSLDIKACIGVTTGKIFAGAIGESSFSQFDLLGADVNFAARLMGYAIKSGKGVLVSSRTKTETHDCVSSIEWERLRRISIKGFDKEIDIWRPHWRRELVKSDLNIKRNEFFIGRKETVSEIKSRLLTTTTRGAVVMIHSVHWGGSTQFARHLIHEIQSQIGVISATNTPFHDGTLSVWNGLLVDMLKECRLFHDDRINDKNCARVMDSLIRFMRDTDGEKYIRYLPVLNALLNVHFKSEESADDDSNVCEYRVQIICHLLRHISKYTRWMICISRLQYMEAKDWRIAHGVAHQIYSGKLSNVWFMLTGWSMDTKSLNYLRSPHEVQVAEQFAKVQKLCSFQFVLPQWSTPEVAEFLKFEFEIEKPSKEILHYVMNKTNGVPGMIECLVEDERLLFMKHGAHLHCAPIEGCRDIMESPQSSDIHVPIPYGIESYYSKMLDSLTPFALLTIKLGAVIAIGQELLSVSFSYDMLHSLHPLKEDGRGEDFDVELHMALCLLERERFVYKFKAIMKGKQQVISLTDLEEYRDKHDNETFYVFSCGYLRDVVYGHMLYKQRCRMHQRAKRLLDCEPYNEDKLVQNCIARHALLSINKDDVELKKEADSVDDSKWSFPQCVLIVYVKDVVGLPDTLKSCAYISIHEKGKMVAQSRTCQEEYMAVVLNESADAAPVLGVRLWHKQNYRADKEIGKLTLRLRQLYEKQISNEMMLKRKSNNYTKLNNNDLYIGYKTRVVVKQKIVNKLNLNVEKPFYIQLFMRFTSVDVDVCQ